MLGYLVPKGTCCYSIAVNMNVGSIGWNRVVLCGTYCLWRVGTSVGSWEGSVHWLKVLNPGLCFSLPRGGLNTIGFGDGHLGSVHCAPWLSHWNWETPSWGVQVAGDRQHEEREREKERKRERERSALRGQCTRLNTAQRSEKFREATDGNLSGSTESCSPSLCNECPRQNWKPPQRAQREHQNLKTSVYVTACTQREPTLKETSSVCFVRCGHYLLQRCKISRATMWVCHFQSLPCVARGLPESRERSGEWEEDWRANVEVWQTGREWGREGRGCPR